MSLQKRILQKSDNTMRLVHVVNAEKALPLFLQGQAGYMRSQGCEVTICSPEGKQLEAFAESEGVSYLPIDIVREIAPLRDLIAIRQLVSTFRRLLPDVVHAHGPKAGLIGMIAAWIARVPVRIYHIRGLPFVSDTQPQRLLRATTKLTCHLATRVLSISPSMSREVVANGCCTTAKVKTLLGGSGNGLDAHERFNPANLPAETRKNVRQRLGIADDDVVIGFIGRLVRDKGVVELVQAWEKLASRSAKWRMLIVGPFEEGNPVPAEIRTLIQSHPRIHWVGQNWNTPPLLAAMDLLTLPSYREGLGMVALEASAMELPVVATNISGCIDAVVDGVTGTLVSVKDAESLAGAIKTYAESPWLRKRHGLQGRKRVLEQFQQEPIWAATYGEYQKLLKSKGLTCWAEEHANSKVAA